MSRPDDDDRRFPRRVYGTGTEPDPRFTLANERTFLAWIRTSLALIAGGVALEAFELPISPVLSLESAVILIALAWMFGYMDLRRAGYWIVGIGVIAGSSELVSTIIGS